MDAEIAVGQTVAPITSRASRARVTARTRLSGGASSSSRAGPRVLLASGSPSRSRSCRAPRITVTLGRGPCHFFLVHAARQTRSAGARVATAVERQRAGTIADKVRQMPHEMDESFVKIATQSMSVHEYVE